MNIFSKVLAKEYGGDTRLGAPADSPEQLERRLTAFRNMNGGKGFQYLRQLPAKDAQGLTRGDRKKAARIKLWGWL